MSLLSLFFEVGAKRLVSGLNSAGAILLPDLNQEDSLTIDLSVVQRTNNITPPFFSYVDIANYALFIAVGTVGSVNASQNTWTKNTDNTVFSGVLPLNTSGINSLADGAQQIFEIRLFDGTSYFRCQQLVTVKKSIALSGALAVPADDTALGAAEASQIYVPYELPAGRGLTFTSPDGTKKQMLFLDNDNTPRWVDLS